MILETKFFFLYFKANPKDIQLFLKGSVSHVVAHKIIKSIKIPCVWKKQGTNGPVNAHLISWPTKAPNIQNLENIW